MLDLWQNRDSLVNWKICHFSVNKEGRFLSSTKRNFYKNWATDLGHNLEWSKWKCLLNADAFLKIEIQETAKEVSTRRDICKSFLQSSNQDDHFCFIQSVLFFLTSLVWTPTSHLIPIFQYSFLEHRFKSFHHRPWLNGFLHFCPLPHHSLSSLLIFLTPFSLPETLIKSFVPESGLDYSFD